MSTAKDGVATWKFDCLLALLAILAGLAINAWTGFDTLTNAQGDNDSLLQLVEVRDLLAGQGWFDMHQYRMGLEGGFVMHWSRLLDAPLALGIHGVSLLTGSMPLAEKVVQVLWPALLFWMTLFSTARAASGFAGKAAVLPSIVIGAAAYHFIGIYSPGSLDHHNVQLMLTMASLALLLEAPRGRKGSAICSGVFAALTLAIGMESTPHALTLAACVALLFAVDGTGERAIARDFGLGFAGLSTFAFLTTIPPSAWGQAQCDAFSVVHFVVGAIGGAGLAAIASIDSATRTRQRRLAALGLLAAALAAVVVLLFPHCLEAPYADLDPRLKELWLDHISEAQSLFKLIVRNPALVAARYATPLVAMILMILRLGRGWRRQDSLVGALLLVAFVVSAWQVRGSTFSIAFAVIPLSAWIARWRARAEASSSPGVALRMAAVWLVSINPVWTGAAAATSLAFDNNAAAADESADKSCEQEASFAPLGRMPDTTVLAISNLGSPILAYSGHRVLAGPYHRNVAGNLLVLDAFLGTPDEALKIVEAHRVGLVAVCRGSVESATLVKKAPRGFLSGLLRGSVPDWLEPIPESKGSSIELYRVRQAG